MWLKFLRFSDHTENGRHYGPFYEGLVYKVDAEVAAKLVAAGVAEETEPRENKGAANV